MGTRNAKWPLLGVLFIATIYVRALLSPVNATLNIGGSCWNYETRLVDALLDGFSTTASFGQPPMDDWQREQDLQLMTSGRLPNVLLWVGFAFALWGKWRHAAVASVVALILASTLMIDFSTRELRMPGVGYVGFLASIWLLAAMSVVIDFKARASRRVYLGGGRTAEINSAAR